MPEVIEAAIEAHGLAQVHGGQYQPPHLQTHKDSQHGDVQHAAFDGGDAVQPDIGRQQYGDKGTDHRLGGQGEDHQRVLPRAQPAQVPVGVFAFFLIHHRAELPIITLGVFHRHGIRAGDFVGHGFGLLEANVGVSDVGIGESGNLRQHLLAVFRGVFDHTKVQRVTQAGGYTGGFQTLFQAVYTHIALGHLALNGVQLRCIVGAYPGAVATAKAGVRILQHGAVFCVLGVSPSGAAFQAHRIIAMVTGHGDVHAFVVGVGAPFHVAHGTEADVGRIAVLFAAGRFTGMAADAVVGGKMKTVLLVPVGVVAHRRVLVDQQGLAFRRATTTEFQQINFAAIAVGIGHLGIKKFGVILLTRALLPGGFGFVIHRIGFSADLVQAIPYFT